MQRLNVNIMFYVFGDSRRKLLAHDSHLAAHHHVIRVLEYTRKSI